MRCGMLACWWLKNLVLEASCGVKLADRFV
jgi:hypothetical protein